MLRLFSALKRGVGASQISIIFIYSGQLVALKRESFDSSGLASTPPPGQAYAAGCMCVLDFFLSESYTSRIALFQLDAGSWLHGQHDGLNLFRGSKFHSWSMLGQSGPSCVCVHSIN